MVSYEVPKPSLGFFQRARESIRLAIAFQKGDKGTIANITADTQFSPLQPVQAGTPQIVGRTWDYTPGINVQFLPRGYGSGRIPFQQLRAASLNCEILRLVIETVKDQICAFDWQIVPKEDSNAKPDDPRVAELTAFFQSPDRVLTFEQWMRMFLEDFLVIDALTIYRPKDRIGRPYAFEIFDGGTIKPLIDEDGRRPMMPDPSFQQIIKGSPRAYYTTDELLYRPRTILPYAPLYGLSLTEQALITIRTSIERAKYQLAYFTEGSLPDAYATMPEGMTPDNIRAFEERFNNILAGNAGERKKVPFLPAGSKIEAMKPPPLKDEFDEWIARIICFDFGLAPTAFIKQMNRSTANSDKERAQEEGQAPKMQFISDVINTLISDFGPDYAANFQFSWKDSKNQDPDEQSQIIDRDVRNASITLNEARAMRGQDPIEGGDKPMYATPTGYVPLDSFEQQQQMQQDNMQAQAEARASAQQQNANNQQQQHGGNKNEPAEKRAYTRLGKAVRHKAIPLARPAVTANTHALTVKIKPILKRAGVSVAAQARAYFSINKAAGDDDDNDFANSVDLGVLDLLVNVTPEEIAAVMKDSGHQALLQLGIGNSTQLTGQVNKASLDYAKARAAEMVGKKWEDDELVDNPDADWVVTDATRDELRGLVSDVLSGNASMSDLPQAIMDAGAFSPKRAELIARTEIMTANAQGSLASYQAAKSAGVDVKKLWEVDDDPCPICQENGDAGAIDLDEDFPSGDDAPTAHPNCECVLVPIVGDNSTNEDDEGD